MCHALVIEDDFLIAEYISLLAKEAGATTTATAATQHEAVCAARECRPAVILADVRLEAGTGPLAVQTIIDEAGDIPVIFITGNPEECVPCAPPGIILSKPVNGRLIKAAFEQVLA